VTVMFIFKSKKRQKKLQSLSIELLPATIFERMHMVLLD